MAPKLKPLKNLIFGEFPTEWPKKVSHDQITFAAQQLYIKVTFRCVVVQEKKNVQDLGRKKRKKIQKKTKNKNENNVIEAKNGLVGMKGFLETYNHAKYFFVIFKSFLNVFFFFFILLNSL